MEGEADEYEELLRDLANGHFESYRDWLQFAKSAYRYKTYLALTLLDMDDWPNIHEANENEETPRIRDTCQTSLENTYLEDCEMDTGENSEALTLSSSQPIPSDRYQMVNGDGSICFPLELKNEEFT